MRKSLYFTVATSTLLLAALPLLAQKTLPSGSAPDPASICDAIAGNLVANCGFETGDFTDWTQSGNTGFTGVTGGYYANSGNYGAYLGPVGSDGDLSQTIGTSAGTYQLQFWLNSDGSTPNDFAATVNGNTLFSVTDLPAQGYTEYTYDFVATGPSDLTFSFRNDPGYLGLDDISVVSTVPEPTSVMWLIAMLPIVAFVLRRRLVKG
jgi:hypothetical protein